MIVCVCHGINDRQIRAAIRNGATTVEALGAALGAGTCCGCCREACGDLIAETACSARCHSVPQGMFALLPV